MRVTLLGHAALLVEMGPMTILMDPVLQDPFEDGIVVSCPNREIDVERLPPVDVIILSIGIQITLICLLWTVSRGIVRSAVR